MKKIVIVFDFDGVFTKLEGGRDNLLKILILPYLVKVLISLLKPIPNKKMLSIIRKIEDRYKLIVLSSRPYFLEKKLKRWLNREGIDCGCYCVGRFLRSTKRKEEFLEKLLNKNFDILYVENNEKVIRRFNRKGFPTKSPFEFCREIENQLVF